MTATGGPRVPRWLLALLSGVLLALSFPGSGDQGWAAFAALVPLLAAVGGVSWRRAGVLGFGAGFVFWVATIPWIAPTMVHYGGLPWPLAALVLAGLAGYLAVYWAAFCALLSRVPVSGGAPFVVAAASLWVALEFLRTYLFTGFPWNLVGYSQYRHLPLIQVAAVTGVYGVSFVVVAVNAALWRVVAADRRRKEAFAAAATAAGVVVLAMASAWLPPRDAGQPSRAVALVQGSIDQGVKWDPAYQDATLAVYRTLTVDAARQGAKLIVWPETALPFLFDEDRRRAAVQSLARETDAYLLVGAPARRSDGRRNSAFLVAPDGDLVGRYDKRHLVPFGEYVPLKRLLPFVEVLGGGAIGDFRSGGEATVFSTPLGRLAVVICYEAIFPAEVRDFFLGGADVLVNITNDAWFGRSAAPVQHLAMAAFRAVENRAYLVRAANTGISAVVAPDGRIVQASGLFTREIVSGTIAPRIGLSVYTRYGDVFAWATVAVVLAVMWPSGSRRRIGMRRMGRTPLALGDEAGRLDVRRGVLAAVFAAAGAIAAMVWGWRPHAAGGDGYQVVAWWTIPGGEGRFVVILPAPSAKDLEAVADRLRDDFSRHENGVAMIFDDVQAARDVRHGSRTLGEERFQAALRHQRAMYLKYAARGDESFVVYAEYPLVRETLRYPVGGTQGSRRPDDAAHRVNGTYRRSKGG
ncbi:MAG: apolipoprotein N-acyltransferase [Candidatus Rokubacteria bacterium]|nr:apolipoprotein N-acyltransferase [Candidatus Rokubacteria bacterium]